jgi:hypothetical protein
MQVVAFGYVTVQQINVQQLRAVFDNHPAEWGKITARAKKYTILKLVQRAARQVRRCAKCKNWPRCIPM